ncbi:MAG: hypothetical protein RJA81_1859 [Planctomycetota bacterium]
MQQLIDIGRDLNAVIIGLGGQGLRRAKAIEIAKGWKLAGVFDTDQKRCRQVCERFHWRLIDCLQTAVSHPDIDLVVIAVPPAHHDEIMKLACQFQKHILCEKPLTIWPENFHEQLPCGVQGSQILATGFNHRFYGPVLDAVELIHQNKLGQIQQINGRIGSPTPDSKLDGWHGNASISGGGVLTDNGSHLIDLLQMILRRPFNTPSSTVKDRHLNQILKLM